MKWWLHWRMPGQAIASSCCYLELEHAIHDAGKKLALGGRLVGIFENTTLAMNEDQIKAELRHPAP